MRLAGIFFSVALLPCAVWAQGSDAVPAATGQLVENEAAGAGTSSSAQSLPEAPEAQAAAGTQAAPQAVQTKRILGIFPNFSAVSADVKLPPQTIRQKFDTAARDSFDYSAIPKRAVVAFYLEAKDTTPEFHKGAPGYARYFWHSYVDQAVENFSVEFIVPALTHQDNRYYTKGKGPFLRRAGYSLTRALVTRNDAGKEVFNVSEVVGAGMAAGISNTYYPRSQRTLGKTLGNWGQNIGIDAGTFVIKEFWPDVNRRFFHGKADQP